MSNFQPKSLRRRALLADVLPFEVPLIFTNDYFFASTLRLNVGQESARALGLMREYSDFTIPLSYSIVKDRGRRTQLSIVHPNVQLRWADFIDQYAETILTYCRKSYISLRHPFSIVSQHATAPLEAEATAKDGLPHELLEEGAPDFSRLSSYFRLRKYNIVSKFLESREIVSLEKRFSNMISLDVSKCFYNIYTHSISWAVKGKKFVKSELGAFTFEDMFDSLMQASNYKETNGIVVGPEISRIFAEIIFQQIDKDLVEGLTHDKWDRDRYSIHRYVDDYFVFANSASDLEYIERKLAACLENYKLYLNTDKRSISQRPFVTAISRAKREISNIIDAVNRDIRQFSANTEANERRAVADEIRRRLRDLRLAVAPNEVGFHNVSGWLMWKLRKICSDALGLMRTAACEKTKDSASQILASVMELAFYVTALDFRVRTGFNLTLLLTQCCNFLDKDNSEQSEFLQNLIFEEFVELSNIVLSSRDLEALEVCNLLIAGAHIFGARFVRLQRIKISIEHLSKNIGFYLGYVTAKFCFLKDKEYYSHNLEILNNATERHVLSSDVHPKVDAELYILMCDLISAPDIDNARRQRLIDHFLEKDRNFGKIGHISEETAEELARLVGFADWNGVRLKHTLVRRQLRSAREY